MLVARVTYGSGFKCLVGVWRLPSRWCNVSQPISVTGGKEMTNENNFRLFSKRRFWAASEKEYKWDRVQYPETQPEFPAIWKNYKDNRKKIRCLLCIQPSTLHIKAGGIQILNKNLKINTNNSLKNIKVTYTKISNAKGKQVIGVTASGISIYN